MKLGLFSVSYAGYWGQHQLDLPAIIAEHRPFARQTDVIGTRSFTTALADRLLEAGLGERDGVIGGSAVLFQDLHVASNPRRDTE